MNTVTIKEFSKGMSDFLNRVAHHGESFTLLWDEIPLAEFRPVAARRKLGDLPEILKALPKLQGPEMDDFENDLAEIRRQGNKEQLEHSRFLQGKSDMPAPKGRIYIAQGSALGLGLNMVEVLKGRIKN